MKRKNTQLLYPPPDKRQHPPDAGEDKLEKLVASSGLQKTKKSFSDVVAQVSEAKVAGVISGLAAFPTRHTLSPHNAQAAEWLKNRFQALGYDDVVFHDFKYKQATKHNVVCTKRGSAEPDKFVIVCAHYDSRMESLADYTSAAPGANDNASGVAALVEAARALRNVDTKCSIRFIGFTGEEQGLLGSIAYANLAESSGMNIALVINLDMIGHPMDPAKPTIIVERDVGNQHTSNDGPSEAFAIQMAQAASYTQLHTKFGSIYQSDYMHFEHYGYVCIGAFDGADSGPFYHSKDDTIDKVNMAFCTDVVRMLVATLLMVAN